MPSNSPACLQRGDRHAVLATSRVRWMSGSYPIWSEDPNRLTGVCPCSSRTGSACWSPPPSRSPRTGACPIASGSPLGWMPRVNGNSPAACARRRRGVGRPNPLHGLAPGRLGLALVPLIEGVPQRDVAVLLGGLASRLVSESPAPRTVRARVSRGSMTSST